MKVFLVIMAIVVLCFFSFVGCDMYNIRSQSGNTIMEAYYHTMGEFTVGFGIFGFALLLGISSLIPSNKKKEEELAKDMYKVP